MDNLPYGPRAANRPVFQFPGHETLSQIVIPEGQFALSGPAEKLDDAHWPVRGDLAHIRLAGRCFVPHYAVPMPRKVTAAGASLLAANRTDADLREALPGGALFNVLDVTGGWAWGQVGEDGCVGYLPVEALEA